MKLSNHFLKIVVFLVLPIVSCSDEDEDPTFSIDPDIAEPANVSPQQQQDPEELDVTRTDTPAMPLAEYETVKFDESSSYLNPEAQESLRELVGRLDGDGPVLLTVRMKDEDVVDATPPTEQFKHLTPERVTAVTAFLEQQGITVAKVAIDEAGVVADIGEDAAMARENGTPDNAQVVVITVTTRSEPEPSEHIPH